MTLHEDHIDRFGLGGIVILIIGFISIVIYTETSIPAIPAILYATSALIGITTASYIIGWGMCRIYERIETWEDEV